MAKRPDNFKGIDLTSPLNRIPSGRVALAQNVRAYAEGAFMLRNGLSNAVSTADSEVASLARMNDTTPEGPPDGNVIIVGTESGKIYVDGTSVATGLSGNPVSIVPFRPNTSVQPWAYIGDNAPSPSVTVSSGFNCAGMIKVRSDGTSRKMGIKEPQTAPIVGINTTTVTQFLSLPANTPPWTNIGGVNSGYNYGGTDPQPPFPTIIATPIAGSTVTLTVTGTATVNGATHSPGDAGPSTANTPGHFVTSPVIVLFAFTDADGNIISQSTAVGAPPVVGNVGASATLTVPSGAEQLQIGINSVAGTYSANSGSYLIEAVVSTSSIPSNTATVGNITAYVWGDSPHSGPVAAYIWKNPNDTGTGTPRSADTAQATVTNNSLIFDSTPEDGTVPVQWTTLNPSGGTVGTIPLFSPAYESEGFQDFNVCVVGTIFFPSGGTYTVQIKNKDQVMFGMGGGVTSPNQPVFGIFGQSVTVVNSLPLLYVSTPNGTGGAVTQSISVNVPAQGIYQFELDWDYWFHTGRSLIVQVSPSPGAGVALLPPLVSGVRTNVSYAYKYRASETGAQSNPSPSSSPQLTPVLANTVASAWSPDPQVDKVDYYRQDQGLASFTYIGTGPNDNGQGGGLNTAIVDTLTDLAAADNPTMNFDDFEPVPSIDTPKSGKVVIVGGVITWKSGDQFNTRWLAGTVIEIGSPTQQAYTLTARPTSPTTIVIADVPDTIGDAAGDGVPYNIAEPILAAQPLPYLFGPTDNINYAFGVGDPLRPGTLYWSKGSNLDSWPDTNQMDVTDPSEPLVNGAMSGGLGVLASIKRFWVIYPNFFNALATVTGTQGSTWTLQATSINRGLFIPRCLAVEGGGNFFFRVDDGIHWSRGGAASVSITDDDLYPLFVHEGSTPQAITRNGVTIYPPDDSKPEKQKFSIVNGYLYYDHVALDGNPHTWVYDVRAGGWIWDTYSVAPTAHAANEGESQQGTLVGCVDGTVRTMESSAPETVTGIVVTPAFGGVGFMSAYECTVEYSSQGTIALAFIAVDTENGSYAPNAVTLPSTGGTVDKFTFKLSPNKWKLMQCQFQSTDHAMQVYLEGFVLQVKAWGSEGQYVPLQPFKPSGGKGAQA